MRKLVALLMALVVLGSVATIALAASKKDEELKLPDELTEEDLQRLYRKYNITENDVRFAKGELPHYLKGTMLDGSKKVIATEDGKLPERLKRKMERYNISCDIIISKNEMISIMEEVRERYIKKYGVDPANPKVVVVDGVPIPKEYAKELVKTGKIEPKSDEIQSSSVGTLAATGPQQVNGIVYIYIFVAKDDVYGHAPDSGWNYVYSTWDALDRFETNFDVDMVDDWWFGYWDLSDILPPDSSWEAVEDLEEDCSWVRDSINEIVFGWADDLDHNGRAIAYNGFYAVGSENVPYVWDWPEDSVVQHEISHLFNAPEGETWPWEHPKCIMNYWYAWEGADVWCSDCWDIVYNNIWGISD